MKRYLFLLAWVDGSESAAGAATDIHAPSDLAPAYANGNPHVFAVLVDAPNQPIAIAFGEARAFHANYTGYDTVSDCLEMTPEYQDTNIQHIVVELASGDPAVVRV